MADDKQQDAVQNDGPVWEEPKTPDAAPAEEPARAMPPRAPWEDAPGSPDFPVWTDEAGWCAGGQIKLTLCLSCSHRQADDTCSGPPNEAMRNDPKRIGCTGYVGIGR